MPLIESFSIDHTRMEAPGVRLAKELQTPNGDTIRVYDLRFCRPNREIISEKALHTLEHLLAGYIREALPNYTIIDISPMGCRTGFYMSLIGTPSIEEVRRGLEYALQKVLETTEIPEANIYQCGSCYLHSLEGAKKVAETLLTRGVGVLESDSLRLSGPVPNRCDVEPTGVTVLGEG